MPVFPFRTRVGDDLRALFKHDRLEAQSDRLGQSSIDPGGGVLEVRDATGGAVAGLGHGGGKSGLLIREGGSWLTMQEHVASVGAALGDRLDAHASRLGAAENRLDSHASRIGAAEGRLDSHASRLGSAENRLDAVEGTAGGIAGLAARLASVEDLADRLDTWAKATGQVPGIPPYPGGAAG